MVPWKRVWRAAVWAIVVTAFTLLIYLLSTFGSQEYIVFLSALEWTLYQYFSFITFGCLAGVFGCLILLALLKEKNSRGLRKNRDLFLFSLACGWGIFAALSSTIAICVVAYVSYTNAFVYNSATSIFLYIIPAIAIVTSVSAAWSFVTSMIMAFRTSWSETVENIHRTTAGSTTEVDSRTNNGPDGGRPPLPENYYSSENHYQYYDTNYGGNSPPGSYGGNPPPGSYQESRSNRDASPGRSKQPDRRNNDVSNGYGYGNPGTGREEDPSRHRGSPSGDIAEDWQNERPNVGQNVQDPVYGGPYIPTQPPRGYEVGDNNARRPPPGAYPPQQWGAPEYSMPATGQNPYVAYTTLNPDQYLNPGSGQGLSAPQPYGQTGAQPHWQSQYQP